VRNDSSESRVHVGVFERAIQADRAVTQLVGAGVPKERITVISAGSPPERYAGLHWQERSGSHAVAGAATGGIIGAVLGGLIATTATLVAGGAAVFAVLSLLAGSGSGALYGGFVGAMMTRGREHEVSDFYDQALHEGQILVAVEHSRGITPDQLEAADRIFAATGVEHLTLPRS
jgi:hypothetical protein